MQVEVTRRGEEGKKLLRYRKNDSGGLNVNWLSFPTKHSTGGTGTSKHVGDALLVFI